MSFSVDHNLIMAKGVHGEDLHSFSLELERFSFAWWMKTGLKTKG